MAMIHAPRKVLATFYGCLMLGGLTGCFGPRVQEEAPPNFSLAGVWELNAALSPDAAKVLASLQPKPRARAQHGAAADGTPAPEVINDPTTDLPPIDLSNPSRYGQAPIGYDERIERNLYRPPLDFQTNALLGGEWLKIRQTDTEMSIVNAARSRTFTPGEHSVVSVPSGVADQVSGWSGHDYVVSLNPQIGPRVQERYSLSADGKHLVVRISVASEGRNRAMNVTRTYDRSTKDPDSLRPTAQETLPPID